MQKIFLILLLGCLACSGTEEASNLSQDETVIEAPFDKEKWATKDGMDYPYRSEMLNAVVYNDTIRTLLKDEILEVLGEPDRTNEGHLYYRIEQTRFGLFPLRTKTMVIKIREDNSIEWIKIHG